MHLARIILDVVALVVSFGLLEQEVVAHEDVGLQFVQCCLSEASDSSESGSAEPDVFLNNVPSFKPGVVVASGLINFPIVQVAATDVDFTGLRPPPSA
jgi:hypothetical protein